MRQHRSIGLDVTLQVALSPAETRRRFSDHPALRPVMDFAEVWFQRANQLYFHDPLAAMTIFEPKLCTFAHGDISIDMSDSSSSGRTTFVANKTGAHEVALTVDAPYCIERFFSAFA